MLIPNELTSINIRNASYYSAYLEMVAKHNRRIAAEKEGKKKPTTAKQPKPKPANEKSSKPTPIPKPKATKEKPTKPSPAMPSKMGKLHKTHKGKSSLQLIDEEEPSQPEPKPEPEHQGKGDEYDVERAIQMSLESFQVQSQAHVGGVTIQEPVAEATRPLPVVEGKGKAIETEEQAAQSLLKKAGPDLEVSRVALAGPNHEHTHEKFTANVFPDVYGSFKLPVDEHVILKESLSSSGTLSSMKNQDDAYTFGDQFLNDKSTEDKPGKLNMDSKLVSMVMVPIHQASSLVPPLSTPIIDLSPPKLVLSTTHAPIFTATKMPTTTLPLPPPPPQQSTSDYELAARVAALEKKLAAFKKKRKTLDNTTQNLGSMVFTLQLRDPPHKIDQTINTVVKEVVHRALHASLSDRFRELPEADMKEILHQRMFENGSYKSLPEQHSTKLLRRLWNGQIGTSFLRNRTSHTKDAKKAGPDLEVSRVALAGPNHEHTHEKFTANVFPDVYGSFKLPVDEHVILKESLSSSGTLSSMKNQDDAYTFGDQFLNDKSTEDKPGKLNMDSKLVSMVMVPIHQASSLVPPLSTPIIDLSPPKLVLSTTHAPIFTATKMPTTTLPLPPPPPQQSTSDYELAARVAALEKKLAAFKKKRKILDNTTQNLGSMVFTLQLRDPPHKIDQTINTVVKEVVHRALHASLSDRFRELPEADMKEILHQRMFENGSYKSLPEQHSTKLLRRLWNGQIGTSFLRNRTSHTKDAMEECHRMLTDQVDLVNPNGHQIVPNIRKPLPLRGPPGDKVRRSALSIFKLKAAHYLDFGLEELVTSLWIKNEREYDISAAYVKSDHTCGFSVSSVSSLIHDAPSDRSKVRSHMRILSVISLKSYVRYGYAFLKEIILHRADYKEYKISEVYFKNLHPNDFKDLKRVEDLQLGIESYQTKLNLTQLDWDASDFLFKEYYTIVSKSWAVIYRDRNNQKKMMQETEVHKFSDGTLHRILEKLDHMVKDFRLFKYNLGMTTRIWSEDDKRRSKEFMEVIEHRFKLWRIFRSLESFVGGMLRDVDYRLIQRTE
nr:hypothetical protein [Tanacetum cinerariifolium]